MLKGEKEKFLCRRFAKLEVFRTKRQWEESKRCELKDLLIEPTEGENIATVPHTGNDQNFLKAKISCPRDLFPRRTRCTKRYDLHIISPLFGVWKLINHPGYRDPLCEGCNNGWSVSTKCTPESLPHQIFRIIWSVLSFLTLMERRLKGHWGANTWTDEQRCSDDRTNMFLSSLQLL